jgi:antibiotic biosynthesis monooxygenase (ABM) superfamily enzyme
VAATPPGLGSSLVVCARVDPAKEVEFAAWHVRWQTAMLASPGAESFEFLPPTPDQEEAVAVARFSSVDAVRVWRHSEANQALMEEARPLVEGGLLMQLTGKAAMEYYVQHSATEVIITQIKPGSETAYRAFAQRIQKVQETFPGYLGSFVQPPHHKETGWTTVLRFDSVRHLNAWMTSAQRADLLKESQDLVHGFQAQRVDTSFPGWVPANPVTGKPPNLWKTAALVLLTLFPVVMIELKFLNPHLRGLPPSVATFIGNAISVLLTTWPLMPLAIRAFRPWLFPEDQPPALVAAMPVILLGCYAIEIAVFWRLL